MSSLVPVSTSGLSTTVLNALSSPNMIRTTSENLPEVQKAIHILAQSATLKPSVIAGIASPIYESVRLIDNSFMLAVKDYKDSLDIASKRDKTIQALVISNPGLYAGGVGAVEIASGYTPELPVIEYVCYPILLIFGFFWGVYDKQKILKDKHEAQKSTHRLKWVSYVSLAEEKRIEENVAFAKKRVRVLAEQVTDDDSRGLRNLDVFDELLQLSKVIRAISGNDLTFNYQGNQTAVSQFMNQFQ